MGKMPGAKADAKDVVTSEETEKAEVAAQLTGEGGCFKSLVPKKSSKDNYHRSRWGSSTISIYIMCIYVIYIYFGLMSIYNYIFR